MPQALKPEALHPADAVRILSLASPVDPARLQRGVEEIVRLGYTPMFDPEKVLARRFFCWHYRRTRDSA
jgi:hypothetical protein